MARILVDHAIGSSARQAGPWLVRAARLGYVAKALVYLLIGGLALLAALRLGGGTTDSRGALRTLGTSGPGHLLLWVIGIGLLGYAAWAVVAAITDADDHGSGAKGIAVRAGLAARSLAYAALGVEALRIAITSRGSGGNGAEHWTARVLTLPMGRWLVGAAGAAIAGYALYQLWRAARKRLAKRLHLGAVDGEVGDWVIGVARFGIAARGIVFLIIGWLVVRAALRYDAQEAGGIGDSLATLGAQRYGTLLLAAAALGLAAYGVWELVNARYRRMRAG